MNIAEIRQKYPQYQSVDDDTLASALHKKYYSDKISIDDFKSKIGLQQQPIQQEKPLQAQPVQSMNPDVGQSIRGLSPTEKAQEATNAYDKFVYGIPVIGGIKKGFDDVAMGGSQLLARGVDALTLGNTNLSKSFDKAQQDKQQAYNDANKADTSGYINDASAFASGLLSGGTEAKILNAGKTAVQQGAKLLPRVLSKAKDIGISAGIGAGLSPVLQERGQEGNQGEFAKQKLIQLGVGGGAGVGGAVLSKSFNYVTKAIKAKKPLDEVADKFVNANLDNLEFNSPKDLKTYKNVARNIFENIKMQPENFDPKVLDDAFTRVNELKKAGFDADTNDAMDFIFSGQSNAMRGNAGGYVSNKVRAVDKSRGEQVNNMLGKFSNVGGDVRDKADIGQDISSSIANKREAYRKDISEQIKPLYYESKYNNVGDATDTKKVGEQIVGTRFNEINLSDYANDIKPTIKRPEFQQKIKYPVMSFLQGKVKRGGRFAKQLKAMDITPKSHPRLFGKNGQDSLDNLDASEFPEFTQAGYKADDAGYMSESDILDAIGNELNGNPIKLNPQNMRQSEINRLRNVEARQREFDSYNQYARDGVKVDQFGNEMPKSTAYDTEDTIDPIYQSEINPQKAFKASQSEALKVPTTQKMLNSAKTLYPDLRMQARPDYLKNSEYWNNQDLNNLPVNSIENIHHARRIIDGKMKKIKTSINGSNPTLLADLKIQRDRIDNILKEDPNFAEADSIFENAMKKIESQDLNRFSSIIKAGQNTNSFTGLLDNIFSEKTTTSQFNNIIKELERNVDGVKNVNRNDILSTYLNENIGKLDDKQSIDTIYNKIFKTDTQKNKIAILTGGKGTPLYKQFETTMNAMKNLKQTKSFFSGSNTLNKIQDNDKAEMLTDTLMLGSALKGGNITKINYVMQKISKFFPVDQTKMDKQGQEIMFNFFVNPKNTEKNLGFIRDLKNVKSQEEAINLMQSKYPELSSVVATQSSRMTGQAMNAMTNPQPEMQQSQQPKRTIDDIKRGFYEKNKTNETDARMQDILKRIRTQKPQASNQTQYQFKRPDFVNDATQAESSGNPDARSKTSTASGLGGFIDSTWNEMKTKYGKQYGLNNKADPMQQQIAIDLLADDNAKYLKQRLKNRDISTKDLHVAHFMGAGGATRMILNIQRGNGNKLAYQTFREASKANKPIFFDKNNGNRPRTINEVYAVLASREK
jgi:hypothetical protein